MTFEEWWTSRSAHAIGSYTDARQSWNAALEEAAKVAEVEAERIRHTSHAEGLGMGDQLRESACLRLAAAIRAKKGE